MAILTRNNIVTNGLVLNLDSLNPQSIPLDPTINNIRSQSGSMAPIYTNPATMSVSWSAPDSSWYVTFKTGSDTTFYKGLWCTLDKNSPFVVLEPTSSRVVFSFKAQAITGSISMSIDLNNNPFSGSSVSNDNRSQEAIFTAPFLLTTSSVSNIYATYTVQTGSANFTGSYYYTFNSIYAVNALPITQETTIRIWDIQHELSTYQTPFTATSRSIWYDLSGNGNHAQLAGNATPIPKYNSLNERVLNFDGTGSYATISSSWSYLSSSAIETVFRVDKFGASEVTSIGGYDQNNTSNFSRPVAGMIYLYNSIRKIEASVITLTQTYRVVTSTTTLNTGSYYHVVFNKDTTAGILQLYVNGRLESTNTFDTGSYAQWVSLGNFQGSNTIQISNTISTNVDAWSASRYLNGKLPIFKLYNRTLSQNEVTQNYNAIKTRFGLT